MQDTDKRYQLRPHPELAKIWPEARVYALRHEITLGKLVAAALREYLERHEGGNR